MITILILLIIMQNNLPVVEAKQEYTKVLKDSINDVVHEKIISMFNDSVKDTQTTKEPILMCFQKKLKEVLDWSPAYVEIHLTKIKRNCAWFNELLTAVIVTNVKILTSVKVNKSKKKVQLKMPDPDKFLHQVFINVAKKIYNHIQKTKEMKIEDESFLNNIISNSIDETIRTQIPIQNILQMYIGTNLDSDESDSDVDETNNEPEENEEPEPEEPDEPEPEEPEEPDEPEEPEEEFDNEEVHKQQIQDEFKPVVPEQTNTFFDAPEIKQINIENEKQQKQKQLMFDDAAPDPIE